MVNLFIVGAAKSSTTSLYHLLNHSKYVNMCSVKEPNYFCDDYDVSKMSNYKRKMYDHISKNLTSNLSQDILHEALIKDLDLYCKLFDFNNNKIKYFGESSTNYFVSSNAAKNIFEYNPSSKIIIILRNPFERIVSHFNMKIQIGELRESSLCNLLRKEIDNMKDSAFNQYESLLSHSLYHKNIMKFLKFFPKNQVLVLFQSTNHQSNFNNYLIENLSFFLNDESLNSFEFNRLNETRNYRFKFLSFLNLNSNYKLFFKKYLPKKTKNLIKETILYSNKKRILKDQSFPESVVNIINNDICKLEKEFNVTLSDWYHG